jgi:UMP-CMP kinase
MKLSFCPFSAFLFASSAVAYTLYLSRKQQQRPPQRPQQQTSSSNKLDNMDHDPNNNTTTTTTTTHPKFQVVFILGGPGSGKGTQCTLLSQKKGWSHLSAGDLLRAERQSGSNLANVINEKISAGQIVPSDITVTLLKNAMEKIYKESQSSSSASSTSSSTSSTKFLIDGFPRSQENCHVWEELMPASVCELKFVLFLDCPEDVMTGRLLERAKTSGRNDDNLETIQKRFKTYYVESMPIVEMYEKRGMLKRVLSDCSVEDVYKEVESFF